MITKVALRIITTIILLFHASLGHAAVTTLLSAYDKKIVAEYLQGSKNTNPVLLLHGFLQTREFSTINRLATALNDMGYSVLNPTLSLGLNERNQSLACEAIHTHSLDDDSDELKQWIDWLYKKTGKIVTVIGHSAAGPVILNSMRKNNAALINHAILISLSYYASGPSASETKQHEAMARKALKMNPKKIESYALNYCQTYPTHAAAFLSYYDWNTEKVSETVGEFSQKLSIIIGINDKRIDSNWRKELDKKYHNVFPIEGANHFFDQAHEFELTDTIEGILTEHSQR